jgi:hypothetical protein
VRNFVSHSRSIPHCYSENDLAVLNPLRLIAFDNRVAAPRGISIGQPCKHSGSKGRSGSNPVSEVHSTATRWRGAICHGNSTPIASVVFWTSDAEASASSDASASCYGVKENVCVLAIVEAPLKLIQVQRQVFLRDIVIGANNTALQERPERFDAVGVDVPANPLIRRMVHALVRASEQLVGLVLIGRNQFDFVIRNLAHKARHGWRVQAADHFANYVALARDRADDASLVEADGIERIGIGVRAEIGTFLVPMTVSILSTEIGFVHFNDSRQRRHLIVSEHRADAMAHIEGRLVSGRASVLFEHPLYLQSAHALLALANQIGDLEPKRQRIIRVLEYRSNERREAIARLLGAFDDLARRFIERLSAALADPIPRPMLDADDALTSATRAFDASGPAEANQQGHAFILGVVLLVNLSKTDHEQTLHPFRTWCQVRYIPHSSGDWSAIDTKMGLCNNLRVFRDRTMRIRLQSVVSRELVALLPIAIQAGHHCEVRDEHLRIKTSVDATVKVARRG